MRLRRLYGIVTALLMLHISFVASDAACATHMAGVSHAAMSNMGDMGGMGDTSPQADCCQGLVSCSATFVSSDARSVLPTLSRDEFFRRTVDTPASVLVAPDTPPPKA